MIADATNLKLRTTIIDQFLNLKCHLPKGARVFAPLPGILESPSCEVGLGLASAKDERLVPRLGAFK